MSSMNWDKIQHTIKSGKNTERKDKKKKKTQHTRDKLQQQKEHLNKPKKQTL